MIHYRGSTITAREVPPVSIAQEPSLVSRLGGDAYLVNALGILVFLTPFDSFGDLTELLGRSVTTIAGYVIGLLILTRIGAVLRLQPIVFYLWVAVYALGTALGLQNSLGVGGRIEPEIASSWQMMGLWALVAYAATTDAGRNRMRTSLLAGLVTACFLYVCFYLAGYHVEDTPERVLDVAGFRTNEAGAMAAIAILLVLVNWAGAAVKTRAILLASSVLAVAVLLLANSRGSTLALVLALLPLLLPSGNRKRFRNLRAIVIFGAVLAALFFAVRTDATDELFGRVTRRWDPTQTADQVTGMRTRIFDAAIDLAIEEPRGIGTGMAKYELARRVNLLAGNPLLDTHNEFLRILLECGWLGFGIYAVGWVALFYGALKRLRQGDPLPLALLIGLFAFCMSGTFGRLKLMWVMLGLVTAEQIRARLAKKAAVTVVFKRR